MTDSRVTDVRLLLERQAAWQKRRASLTWPEKVRMAEAVREEAARFPRKRPRGPDTRSSMIDSPR